MDLKVMYRSVLLFDDETIDDYLEFCQRALLSREDRGTDTDSLELTYPN